MKARLCVLPARLFFLLILGALFGAGVSAARGAIDPAFSDANWIVMNSNIPGADNYVYAAAADNAGNLYVAGAFAVVGDAAASYVARWDGSHWTALGAGVGGQVNALAVSGSNVYVGGTFTTAGGAPASHVARWDGSHWAPLGLGVNGSVTALTVSSNNLYVAGSFSSAGGNPAAWLAKWDGSSWSGLISGLNGGSPAGPGPAMSALAVSGNTLYVGGRFNTVSNLSGVGVSANGIAQWDGTTWSAVGLSLSGSVSTLALSGSHLYVGGNFKTATNGGGAAVTVNSIAQWDGSNWSALGLGVGGSVSALAVSGSNLYIGGSFTTATNGGGTALTVNSVAQWNGSAWSALGPGVGSSVMALAVSGNTLCAGGKFTAPGGSTAKYLAGWNGTNWTTLGPGSGMNNPVYALAASGSNLYVGGTFTSTGSNAVNYIAQWNGRSWTALGSGMNNAVLALTVSGQDLYAGGNFTTVGGTPANYIAKWDGSNWTALGSGMGRTDGLTPRVAMLAAAGGSVYAVGTFTTAGGSSAPNGLAKWDGTHWTAVGSGMNGTVSALAVSGSTVYAAGYFSITGGTPVNTVAKWDGSSWSDLGLGPNDYVNALATDGSNLYAAGEFTMAGLTPAANIARWDGANWSALGSGVNYTLTALALSGTNLYATGGFSIAGGSAANCIAQWDGSSWSALGSGLGGALLGAQALVVSSNSLYVGGSFLLAGGKASPYFARAWLPALPALALAPSGTGIMVSWPSADTAGLALEQSSALGPQASWVPIAAGVSDDGTNKSVTLPATDSPQFFRLHGL